MIRTIFTTLGLLILSSISAQDNQRFNFQFDYGANISIPSTRSYETMTEIDGHPETKYQSGLGYLAEILMTYNIDNSLGLQSGINYSLSKLRVTDKVGLIKSNGDIKATYINIPILIKYRLSDFSPFSVSAGTSLGLILNANQNGTSIIDTAGFVVPPGVEPPIVEPKTNYSDDIKSNFKDFDFGLILQVDYEFPVSERFSGLIFSRFNYGFLDVKSDEFHVGSNYSINKWHNIGFIMGLGIKI